jgi:hypothetical protein
MERRKYCVGPVALYCTWTIPTIRITPLFLLLLKAPPPPLIGGDKEEEEEEVRCACKKVAAVPTRFAGEIKKHCL